jgi:glyoxylase-like metal-dependent hydrolase (beta-lactamase superfamily II)
VADRRVTRLRYDGTVRHRPKRRLTPLAILALSALSAPAPLLAQELRVTYLANEGVLVENGANRILIDALFRDSLEPYSRHSRDVQERLETGQEPYDGIGLALATHFHLDHWDAGAISRFLRSNPRALFASTDDATAMIPAAVRERVRNLWNADGRSSTLVAGGATVAAIPLTHGTTQNLAYRLDLSGRTVAHLGDADPSDENFRKLASAGRVDLALVPFWWLLDAKATSFLKAGWKPRTLAALHIGATDLGSLPAVQSAWPGVWAPTKPGDSRAF